MRNGNGEFDLSRVKNLGVKQGYDLWADTYDQTLNPIVWMDARYSLSLLAPQPAEMILDAGCGTGRNFAPIVAAGSNLIAMDFSLQMLKVAHQRNLAIPLISADLEKGFPYRTTTFDAVLSALIGEHLKDLDKVFAEIYRVLKINGRLLFSVYHPALAAAGKEANFVHDGTEYRLGAYKHTIKDYLAYLAQAGFTQIEHYEFYGDAELVESLPLAARYLNHPLLLILKAEKRYA